MDIRVNDVLLMKKAHPCGEKRWKVLRTGMDFRLRCLGCGHEVMLPRSKAEKSVKRLPAGRNVNADQDLVVRLEQSFGKGNVKVVEKRIENIRRMK